MKPDNELIRLARRFWELGGCEGTEITYGKWYGDRVLKNPYLWTNILPLKSDECFPILTESELWAWLSPVNRGEEVLLVFDYNYIIIKCWFNDTLGYIERKIEICNNLHHALYSAAVWVAERKEQEDDDR